MSNASGSRPTMMFSPFWAWRLDLYILLSLSRQHQGQSLLAGAAHPGPRRPGLVVAHEPADQERTCDRWTATGNTRSPRRAVLRSGFVRENRRENQTSAISGHAWQPAVNERHLLETLPFRGNTGQ